MKVLLACEESQAVCIEFRKLGHEAYSCDTQECSGGHPEWHIKDDVLKHLSDDWDMVIAFPPCTAICVAGNRHYANTQARLDAIKFVERIWDSNDKIVIENPVGVLSTQSKLFLPQYIQPWMFGDQVEKKTGLWIKGVAPLRPNTFTRPEIEVVTLSSGARMSRWYYDTSCLHKDERAKARSKTFPGIAKAMADQWG